MSKVTDYKRLIEVATEATKDFKNPFFTRMYLYALKKLKEENDPSYFNFIKNLSEPPVDIETFLDHPDFMGATDLLLWPEVRKSLIEMNKNWWNESAYQQVLLHGSTSNGKCVDGETEFLTKYGWKKISDYSLEDRIAQYDTKTGYASFVEPEDYIVQNNIEGFYNFSFDKIDMKLTPNHKVLAIRASSYDDRLQVLTAKQLAGHINNDNRAFLNSFSIPSVFAVKHGIRLSNHVLASLAIALLHNLNIYSVKKLIGTFNQLVLNINTLKDKDSILEYLAKRNVAHYIQCELNIHLTYIYLEYGVSVSQIWQLDSVQLHYIRSCIDSLLPPSRVKNFHTETKEYADILQFIYTATGNSSIINTLLNGEHTVSVSDELYYGLVRSEMESEISATKSFNKELEYCFTVPTGFWVARRNNRIFVTGNSEMSKVTTAYHLYLLGCMKSPQAYYGLPESTTINFVIQAAKSHVTRVVIFKPLRKYIETMPWFQKKMRPFPHLDNTMLFDRHNIMINMGGTGADSALGEAVIGGIIDEINFFQIVANSTKVQTVSGRAGIFDQATQVYDTLVRRRKGRFLKPGPHIGMLIASSSTRYLGDFTDTLSKQIKEREWKHIYEYRKAQYEARPHESRYSGDYFLLRIKNQSATDVEIILDKECRDRENTLQIPIEYLEDFQRDTAMAMRDVIGISSLGLHPFITSHEKLYACIDTAQESILMKDNVILADDGFLQVKYKTYCRDPTKPRYLHVDLSISGDLMGIAMIRFDGIREQITPGSDGESMERLPLAVVEIAATVKPDKVNNIDFPTIRSFIQQLRQKFGYPIKVVTYDGFQSVESRQLLSKAGFRVGLQSVDRTDIPYKSLRDAIYEGRIKFYNQELLIEELLNLEYYEDKRKIDHNAKFCFTGDTLVYCTDSSHLTFDELTKDWNNDIIHYGVGFIKDSVTSIILKNPRITKMSDILIEIELENGCVERCTSEHLFLLTSGEYKMAKELSLNDELQT